MIIGRRSIQLYCLRILNREEVSTNSNSFLIFNLHMNQMKIVLSVLWLLDVDKVRKNNRKIIESYCPSLLSQLKIDKINLFVTLSQRNYILISI